MSMHYMKGLLQNSYQRRQGSGSLYSVGNMEMILGAVKNARKELNTIILQIAEVRLHSPLLPLNQ